MTDKAQVEALNKAFLLKAEAMTEALVKGITKASIFVEGRAKLNTPVDTGNLRKSIRYDVSRSGRVVTGQVGTNVEYAPFIEFGTGIYASGGGGRKTPWFVELPDGTGFFTRGNKPTFFLTRSLTENKQKIRTLVIEELRKEL